MASTYLSRTASSGSQRTFTVSFWVKRSSIGSSYNYFFSSYQDGNNRVSMTFLDTDHFIMVGLNGGSAQFNLTSNRVFRDVNAWYHIVISVDTTQATSSDRIKLYINGVQETSFSTENYPSQNADLITNTNHYIGTYDTSTNYLDGALAHYHYIDGTAYAASAFGETDATTGIWKPKTAPSVTYGTNGFFLKFENSGAFGTDSSGNGNTFTVNGTMTQTIDTPSNVFCTMNPLFKWNNPMNYSNGNLSLSGTGSGWEGSIATLAVSKGKWYYEAKFTSATDIGNWYIGWNSYDIIDTSAPYKHAVNFNNSQGGEMYVADTTQSGTDNDYGTFVNGDIIGVALDYDNTLISIYKNGTVIVSDFNYSTTPTSGKDTSISNGKMIAPGVANFSSGAITFNFGNGYFGTTAVSSANADDNGIGAFEYAPPTGYLALCTKNINAQEYS